MEELSCFLDESGSDNLRDKYYLLTLVLHEQSRQIYDNIALYERSLADRGLPDVPFHAGPLMTGHDAYDGMDIQTRKQYLSAFRVLFRHMPVRHTTFTFRMRLSQVADYVCTMELAALRYRGGESTPTDDKFFGTWREFKKGILKEVRAKRIQGPDCL
ncbi:MAG: hypothetical protein PUE38_06785 [Olsenella sp.]|nr:hypothetical protein [Olsenella sp.]